MSQSSKTRKKAAHRPHGERSTPGVQNQTPTPPKPVVTTPDSAFEKQITRLVSGFIGRILMSFFIVAILIEVGIQQAKISQQNTLPIIAAATFGIMFPFVRGAGKVFREIKRLGIERVERRKYADAQFAFEYFHRFGQMSFDPTGEAHYYLVRALIGLGNMDRARMMVTWLQKHRRRHDWPGKAAEALAAAERKQTPAEPTLTGIRPDGA